MEKSMLISGLVGAAVVTAGGAGALTYYQASQPVYAEIVAVTPQHKTVQEPREQCEEVQVTEQAAVKDENRVVGTVAGALIGGLLGSKVGGGSGKKLATVAGAAAGGYAGNKTQENLQKQDTVTRTEQRCSTVMESKQVLTGYEVEYRIAEQAGKTTLSEKPMARRYQVLDGRPLFDQPVPDEPAA